jgi:hypothetical protein
MLTEEADGATLEPEVLKLQQFFQNQILKLDGNELSPELEQRIYSFQVEIDKQLRLLGMDIMFLQAARQEATGSQRRSQVSDRLSTLIRYCEAVLGD